MSDKSNDTAIEDRGEHALAQAREHAQLTSGHTSIPKWTIVALGMLCASAFAYFGAHVDQLSNEQFTETNYVAVGPQDEDGAGQEKTPLEELMALGERQFGTCAGCHGVTGQGGAGYPPLAGSEWVSGATETLGLIIVNGLAGPIKVKGVAYNSNMAPQGANMSAGDLAAVMTYVRLKFADPDLLDPETAVISEEVAENILQIAREHGKQYTAGELQSNHDKNTEGQRLDPATGEPVS